MDMLFFIRRGCVAFSETRKAIQTITALKPGTHLLDSPPWVVEITPALHNYSDSAKRAVPLPTLLTYADGWMKCERQAKLERKN